MADNIGRGYQELIGKLDRFIRKYYLNKLVRGTLLFIGVCVFAWIIFAGAAYYLYLDRGIRKAIFFGSLIAGSAGLFWWILRPLFAYLRLGKTINHDQAAVIIGDHFSEVKDKLLNILQLKRQLDHSPDHSLLVASIDQKTADLKPVAFRKAIDLNKNKRFLPYVLPPLALLAGLFLISPEIIRDGSTRILRNNENFKRPAPFTFELEQTGLLRAIQHEDFQVSVRADGEAIPTVAYIEFDDHSYEMRPESPGVFSYNFNSIGSEKDFVIRSGDISSNPYHVDVVQKPRFESIVLKVDYPSHTGLRDEIFKNRGDINVPQGTRLTWELETSPSSKLELAYTGSEIEELTETDKAHFSWVKRPMKDVSYKMYLSNADLHRADSASYTIEVTPDRRPTLRIEQILDSTNQAYAFYTATIEDDYGLKKWELVYQIMDENGQLLNEGSQSLAVLSGLTATQEYLFEADSFTIPEAGSMTYHFRAWDNDGVKGSKYAKSANYTYRVKSAKEKKAEIQKRSEDIRKDFDKNLDKTKELREQLEKMRERLIKKDELNWKDKKNLQDLLKKQQDIKQNMDQMMSQLQENREQDQSLSEEEKEKIEELEKMMEDVMKDEMEKLMEDIQKLMEEMQREQSLDQMQDMQQQSEKMEMDLERMQELFNQLEVEKAVREQIEELEKLAKEQEELSQDTERSDKSLEELEQKQEELNERFDEVKKELDEARKKNEELKQKHEIEDTEALEKLIDRDQEKSKEELEKAQDKEEATKEEDSETQDGDQQDGEEQDGEQQPQEQSSPSDSKQKASKSQKGAAKKMQQMAQQLQQGMEAGDMDQMSEDMEMIRQLLENILTLSFDQEDLQEFIGKTNRQTSRYVELVRDQHKIEDDFSIVKDSLKALSQRNDQIQGFVMDKVFDIEGRLSKSIKLLEDRKPSKAAVDQGFIMTYLNDLALMLNESMENMQQQMSGMMQGSKMCNKPKPGAGGKPGSVPMDKITQGQQEIQKGLQKMMQGQKEGQQPSSEDFGRMAQQQAALRKMLRDAQKSNGEQGKNNGLLQEIIDAMDGVEKNLVNKQLTNEMLKRQQEITTRLLQAEKAERERELDEERKSKTAQAVQKELPPAIEAYLKERKTSVKQVDRASPSLTPYYKRLVDLYYKELEG